MAVVHVTNWAEFKSAVAVSGNTVIVDNNIDANGSYVTSPITISCTTIQGGGHTIYNIYGNTNIFNGASNTRHVVEDLNFANVDTSAASSGGSIFRGTGSSTYIDVYRCNIQGNLKLVASGYTTFTSCAIVISGGGIHYGFSNMAAGGPHFTQCYIDLGEAFQITGTAFAVYTYFRNCYFKGTWKLTQNTFFMGNSTPAQSYNNVFNVHLTADSAQTLSFFSSNGGTDISIYNTDRINGNITMAGLRNCLIGLDDAKMKNATEIAAVGFPIIT